MECEGKGTGLLCGSEDGSGREEKRSKKTYVRGLDIDMRQAASENGADEVRVRSSKQGHHGPEYSCQLERRVREACLYECGP